MSPGSQMKFADNHHGRLTDCHFVFVRFAAWTGVIVGSIFYQVDLDDANTKFGVSACRACRACHACHAPRLTIFSCACSPERHEAAHGSPIGRC